MFEMKEEYKIGITLIDEEHKQLFEICERGYQLLKDSFTKDKYDKIVEVIEELREYTVRHFKDEEEYMESINYNKIFTQKIEHANFIKKIYEIDLSKIDENQDEAIMGILTLLNDWLINHIFKKDMLIPKK